MDVTSLYTNIPQEEGSTTVCKAYEDFYQNHLPIPTKFLRQMLCLIQFNGRHYLQTHETAMGTKMAVAFANVFMAKIEKDIISKSKIKLLVWKRYIDDVFCVRHTTEDNIENFVQRANNYHDTIKFTAEISQKCTKARDSIENPPLMCKHITNGQRPFNTRIFIRAIHQALRKDS